MALTTVPAILDRARDIAQSVAAPHASEVDQTAIWPEATIRALQHAGLGGLVVPYAHGGLGQGLHTLVQVCEILGQACSSSALCYGMHCVGSAVIAAKATPVQVREYLEPIAAGKHLTTLAVSEPGTGAHFYLPQTQLHSAPDNTLCVSGQKTFVTNGGHADSYVISTVAADPQAPPGQFSCVILPADSAGLQWGPAWHGLGMRGNSSCSLEMQGVAIPRSLLLGKEGDEIWYVFAVIAPYFLIAMAGTYLGVAQAALDALRDHLKQRTYAHSGGSLAQHAVVQHRFGSLWARLEATRQLIYTAAHKAAASDPQAVAFLASAKAEVAECAVYVVNEAMTLMGGIAYRDHALMSRLLRDVRAAHVMSPTTDLLRLWTGRALLGLPLLVD